MSGQVYPLQGSVQHYAWGRVGPDSTVAQLYESSTKNTIKSSEPYAELWMGTHPKAPSRVVLPDKTTKELHVLLHEQPDLGGNCCRNGQLPYLFKVLSVNKTLSIQAHPDKTLAEHLHSVDPEHYPDPNHKPEMCIAITPFEGMCGFRMLDEIAAFISMYEELQLVVGDGAINEIRLAAASTSAEEKKNALKNCFQTLMTAEKAVIFSSIEQLKEKLLAKDKPSETENYFLRLCQQFPGDVGCLCIFLLNPVLLQPGEAMFLRSNLPHAYMSGDCVECMACSDNVVRAGCTPKFKDVNTLVEMLTYDTGTPSEQLFASHPHPVDPSHIQVFDPPVPDFKVAQIKTGASAGSIKLPEESTPSILIITLGNGILNDSHTAHPAPRGACFFIPANVSTHLESIQPITAYRAYC